MQVLQQGSSLFAKRVDTLNSQNVSARQLVAIIVITRAVVAKTSRTSRQCKFFFLHFPISYPPALFSLSPSLSFFHFSSSPLLRPKFVELQRLQNKEATSSACRSVASIWIRCLFEPTFSEVIWGERQWQRNVHRVSKNAQRIFWDTV